MRNADNTISSPSANYRIVVVGDDFWNTYGIFRALGEAGKKASFINICNDKSFVKHSRYINRYWQVQSTADALTTLLDNFNSADFKTIVFCSSDATVALIDENFDVLKDNFITFNCNHSQGNLNHIMGKDVMLEFASASGLTVPATMSVDLGKDLNVDDWNPFPCITKSENSTDGGKDNLCRCNNETELYEALTNARKRGCHKVQIQQFIEKECELLITGCADGKGNVVLPGIIKKITEYPMGFTALASIEPDIERYVDPKLVSDFVVKTGFSGIFSLEFLKKGDKAYFMEINLRNDGNSYASIPGGVNIHNMWTECMMNINNLPTNARIDRAYLFQVEPNSLNYHVFKGNGYKSFLKEFIKVDFRLICNLHDPLPALYRFILNKLPI